MNTRQHIYRGFHINIEPHIGKKYSEQKQIARIGNSVSPPVATALVRANLLDLAYKSQLHTVAELNKAISRYAI